MTDREIIIEQKGAAKGLLKDTTFNKSFSEEESLESTMDEDLELNKIIKQRENQPEIEVDIDDL